PVRRRPQPATLRPYTTLFRSPRGALPKALARIRELSEKYQLGCANVFHAGDGNLHPLILYDANKPGEMERAEAFGALHFARLIRSEEHTSELLSPLNLVCRLL